MITKTNTLTDIRACIIEHEPHFYHRYVQLLSTNCTAIFDLLDSKIAATSETTAGASDSSAIRNPVLCNGVIN